MTDNARYGDDWKGTKRRIGAKERGKGERLKRKIGATRVHVSKTQTERKGNVCVKWKGYQPSDERGLLRYSNGGISRHGTDLSGRRHTNRVGKKK